jgi:hypothetical protein
LAGDSALFAVRSQYAKNLSEYCKKEASTLQGMELMLHKYRCITGEQAQVEDDAAKVSKELRTKLAIDCKKNIAIACRALGHLDGENLDGGGCLALLTEINLSDMFVWNNGQWPPGDNGTEPGNGWTGTFLGGVTISHIPDYGRSRSTDSRTLTTEIADLHTWHSPHSPIWNVYVQDNSIIDGHSDIGRTRLKWLLQQLYHSVVLTSYDSKVVYGVGHEANKSFKERCDRVSPG